ncbi:hypothetical protein MN202_09630 [Rheinheimera muenzenbergensis]|uniref:Uncharacterized protein n=1 Tax=Rheinheimera muenzenbergensis TaxID=1193628 RepID=A0ABU8C6U0_9GAMM
MSAQQDKLLAAVHKRLDELQLELERLAEAGSAAPAEESDDDNTSTTTEQTTGCGSGIIPVLAVNRGADTPLTMGEQEVSLKGKIVQKAGEVIAEQAADEIAAKLSAGPITSSSGAVTYPCGFSGEISVEGNGSFTTTFWWNATDGEIADYAPTANEQTKRQADTGLQAQLAALITSGCEAPCKPTLKIIGDVSYQYGSSRTEVGKFTTDVTYTCKATQKVKLTCSQ